MNTSASTISVDAAERLLEAITVSEGAASISDRRLRFLISLIELTGADAGFWCWGKGHPMLGDVTPLATITHGFSEQEWRDVATVGMTPEAYRYYREPYIPYLAKSDRVCFTRSMLWSDDEWQNSPLFQQHLTKIGWSNWVIGVRFANSETWACLSLHRRLAKQDFTEEHARIVNLAFSAPWMWGPSEVVSDAQNLVELSSRQRDVMLCLLEGVPRKKIAQNLGISVHTVNDHIKAIYDRLAVRSIGELAAKLLRTQ